MYTWAIFKRGYECIDRVIDCPKFALAMQLSSNELYIECSDLVSDESHWVKEGRVIAPKGDYPLSSLPLPCIITIEGIEYSLSEQPEISFCSPGEYIIKVDAGPRFLVKEFTVEA